MHWIAPSEKDTANGTLEKRLWDAADQFRANSGLTAAQYSQPVLGLIFLRFAEVRFAAKRAKLDKTSIPGHGTAVLSLRYDPSDKSAPKDVWEPKGSILFRIFASPFGRIYPVRVEFTAPK